MKTTNWLWIVTLALVFQCMDVSAETGATDHEAFKPGAETVIVTGSNRGLGLGWVTHFLQRGASVIATCRSPAEAKELHALKAKYGAQLLIEQLDVTDEVSLERLGATLAARNITLDIAVSNAGVTVT